MHAAADALAAWLGGQPQVGRRMVAIRLSVVVLDGSATPGASRQEVVHAPPRLTGVTSPVLTTRCTEKA